MLIGYALNCYQCLPNVDECFENGNVNSENIITCDSEFNACYTSTIYSSYKNLYGSSIRGCAILPYGMKNEDCKNDEHFVRHCFCTSDKCNFEHRPKPCYMQGYTWNLSDIIYPILQTSYQECFEKCLQNDNCLGWTWYPPNR